MQNGNSGFDTELDHPPKADDDTGWKTWCPSYFLSEVLLKTNTPQQVFDFQTSKQHKPKQKQDASIQDLNAGLFMR